ncbi:MAG: helix-turn-helix domain-containing protein, partial [Actinomycetota bacterium]
MPVDDRIPPFLTVEEASRLLKIGRTKAYDLTKEWRATGGRSGLHVVDLGDVLRVPRPALEEMLGAALPAAPPSKNGGDGRME